MTERTLYTREIQWSVGEHY